MKDEILAELWAIKDGIAKECGYDVKRLFDRLKKSQKKSKHRLVNRTNARGNVHLAH
jgi:hypothetical protein